MNIKETLEPKLLSHYEVVAGIEDFAAGKVDEILKSVPDSWQPSDFLPNSGSESWLPELKAFREQVQVVPDDLLAVLVGDMVTEEALPSYQSWLNNLDGLTDKPGDGKNAWARWIRGWTAEENRHGDLLNRYLYLSGRVNMAEVERTVQYLIRNGFNPRTDNDPYMGFIYTSFQERATKISHRNVAILAVGAGEDRLQTICGLIAGDEARHEKAYTAFAGKIFEVDPSGALLAFESMMRRRIVMPGELMNGEHQPDLYNNFTLVAQRLGVYTAMDYASITAHLVETWNVKNLTGLTPEARAAQDYLGELPARYERISRRISTPKHPIKFPWLHHKAV
jgi:acyl-[acyl-carrier-protein] desaturase